MLPDEEVIDPESVWKGNDGRDGDAKEAFESVFHVSNTRSASKKEPQLLPKKKKKCRPRNTYVQL